MEYAKCGKCNEGNLLPFFDETGKNIYGCTNPKCGAVFQIISHGRTYLVIGNEKLMTTQRVAVYSEKPEEKKE